MRASVALGEPCTMIYKNMSVKKQDVKSFTDHLSGVNLRDDRLCRSSIIQAFQINKEKSAGELYFHNARNELRWWFPRSPLREIVTSRHGRKS